MKTRFYGHVTQIQVHPDLYFLCFMFHSKTQVRECLYIKCGYLYIYFFFCLLVGVLCLENGMKKGVGRDIVVGKEQAR